MNKSILVIDTPKNCWECPIHIESFEDDADGEITTCNGTPSSRVLIPRRRIPLCPIGRKIDCDSYLNYFSDIPKYCPLKPLPKKRGDITLTERTQNIDMVKWQLENKLTAKGWNDCIDKIIGKDE